MYMFKRVGKEIKVWATVLFILQLIPVVLLGLAAIGAGFILSDQMGEEYFVVLGIVAGILIIVVGYVLARLNAITLYARGEAVDRLMRIDERLKQLEQQRTSAPAPAPAPVPTPGFTPDYAPGTFYSAPPAPAPQPVAPVFTPPVEEPEEDATVAAVPPVSPVIPAAREWFCPVCGQKNDSDGSWCRNCGTKRSC